MSIDQPKLELFLRLNWLVSAMLSIADLVSIVSTNNFCCLAAYEHESNRLNASEMELARTGRNLGPALDLIRAAGKSLKPEQLPGPGASKMVRHFTVDNGRAAR